MKVKNKVLSASTFATLSFFACQSTADQVFNDEVIIVASLCVGVDCVNGENFNYDTIRLKENNLRIKFQDTSSTSSFPSVDWQLTANDSGNGGQNYFAIENVDTTQVPFKVASGARTNALYIADNDFVGLGTSTPSVNLHLKSGNSPALRLEQDGSSGFSAQTWDVAGNETNFFVRDVSNSSSIPFKIRPSAPTNSIFIDTDGDIGLGTASPQNTLHLRRADGNTAMLIQEASPVRDNTRVLLQLQNNGSAKINLIDASPETPSNWILATTEGNLVINEKSNVGSPELTLTENGDLDIRGDVTANNVLLTSDKNLKENFSSLDYQNILNKVSGLDVLKWNYITENKNSQHIGPMAQDFKAAFGLGDSEEHRSSIDISGVSLAAIKGLRQLIHEQDQQINKLQQQVEQLKQKKDRAKH